jgi:N-methylhydantoinase A
LDIDRARHVVETFAKHVQLRPEEVCEGVLEIANANMEGAIRVISVERGFDPREFLLISFGGAGGMHAADLARRLSMPEVLIPANPGLLSAFGMLISDYRQEYAQTVRVPSADFTPSRAAEAFRDVEARGREAMRAEGVAPENVQVTRFVDMCYTGQSFELVVPFGPGFVEEFHRLHEQRYGYEDSARPTQVVNVRIQVEGPSDTPYRPSTALEHRGDAHQARVDTLAMYHDGHWYEAAVFDRELLQPGDRFSGPALVAEYSATTVVPPDFSARLDGRWNLLLRAV